MRLPERRSAVVSKEVRGMPRHPNLVILAIVAILLLFAVLLSLSSEPAHAASTSGNPCTNEGQSVAPDPEGDVANPELDIRDISIAEPFAGPHAGKFMLTLWMKQLGSPSPASSGLWIVSWKGSGGQTTTRLTFSNCSGQLAYGYQYTTPDGSGDQSGTPDDGAIFPDGRIRFIVSRDKFGDPPAGAELTDITALTEPLGAVPPAGCIPAIGGQDLSNQPGTYAMGTCVLAAPPTTHPASLQLGPALPNPARAGVHWTLVVPAAFVGKQASVGVLDASGRRVRTLFVGPLASREMRLDWDLRSTSRTRVAPGTYWISARVGDDVGSERVQVLR
jgi:hypothetical protein